ncbi:hypothetical protein Tco_1000587 [Tanacetum coccineum]
MKDHLPYLSNPPLNQLIPSKSYIGVQQHQDEPIYDAWTHFKNLIQRVPHHGLDLWSLAQFFYHHVDQYTQVDLDFAADGNLRELSEIENLKVHAKRLLGNENVWVEMHRNITWDKVENPNPQNTPQVPPSFEEATPPVTYPEEVDETIGTPIEVEPLNKIKLEEVGLNCNHNTPLSSREVPSFDGPESQPLLNSPSLDEMFNDDWGLESKEVSPLGEELSLFYRPNEVERGRILEAHCLEPIL